MSDNLNNKDDNIFDDTSLSDVFRDIYKNSKERKSDIDEIMESFMKHIKKNKDVSFIGPVIKDLIHVSVQNDEQLVKMATIVQRIMTNNDSGDDGLLSDSDKEALLRIAEKSNEDITKSIPDDFGEMEEVMLKGESDEDDVDYEYEEIDIDDEDDIEV